MKYLLVLVLTVLLGACSFFQQPGCFLQEQLVGVAASAVSETLQCADLAAVKADLDEVVGKVGMCEKTVYQTGQLADTVCPIVTGMVVGFVTENAVPVKWKCSATNAKSKVAEALLDACKKLPVSK